MRNKLGFAATTLCISVILAILFDGGAAGAVTLPQLPGGTPTVSIPTCPPGTHILDLSHPICVPLPGATTVPTVPSVPIPNPGGSGSGSGSGGGGSSGGSGGSSGTTTTTPGTTATPGSGNTSVTVSPGAGGNGATYGGGRNGSGNGGSKTPMKDLKPPPAYQQNGTPTIGNPTTTIAPAGPAPIGVPNFVISQFDIPPFLLPIYQACGTEYDIPWQVLASINKIETAFGTNLNTSTAGAQGWMQFEPSTWAAYGVDANGDGKKDLYNPVDAICGAARYLRASGGNIDIRSAIFSYNHASWYVDEVMLYARTYSGIPTPLLGSLTGLTQDDHFPIAANSRYADDLSVRTALHDSRTAATQYGNAANVIEGSPTARGINIYSREGAPVVAVNDGVIQKLGHSKKLGNFIVLRDDYGNTFTYAQLGSFARSHPVPKAVQPSKDGLSFAPRSAGKAPKAPASSKAPAKPQPAPSSQDFGTVLRDIGSRISDGGKSRAKKSGGLGDQLDGVAGKKVPGYSTFKGFFSQALGLTHKNATLAPLGKGSHVAGGTVLARVGPSQGGVAPHINFAISPVGKGAKRIDPKPILDGWKLLESTAIYRAAGKNPFTRATDIGGVLLLPKTALERRALADPRLDIYPCGRNDIRTGQVDRRVLAAMEFLAAKGFRLTIGSLKCGAEHAGNREIALQDRGGDGMVITAINSVPVQGHSGNGTLSDAVTSTALQMQGTMRPDEAQTTTVRKTFAPPAKAPAKKQKSGKKSKPKASAKTPKKAEPAKARTVSADTKAAKAPKKPKASKPAAAKSSGTTKVLHIAFRPLTGNGFYEDPFLHANVVQGSTDNRSVNYAGNGPIDSMGDGQILGAGNNGLVYRLTDGPRKGQVVFVNGGLTPNVKDKQRVLAGQQLASFTPNDSVDIGFAKASGAPLPQGLKMKKFLESIQGSSSSQLFTQFLTSGDPSLQIVPSGTTIFEGQRVCSYIVPILQSARSLGWTGQVLSGYRSLAEQTAIHASGVFSALPGTSNHEGCAGGTSGPGNGAVDVSDYVGFGSAMAQLGYPLRNTLGAVDPGHFSPGGN